ncbi:MAG: hypothetical protein Q9212_007372 [Teloschistes hypoglaucus]
MTVLLGLGGALRASLESRREMDRERRETTEMQLLLVLPLSELSLEDKEFGTTQSIGEVEQLGERELLGKDGLPEDEETQV